MNEPPRHIALHLLISQPTADYLDQLVAAGLHGPNRAEVAERLICRALESFLKEGLVHGQHNGLRGLQKDNTGGSP